MLELSESAPKAPKWYSKLWQRIVENETAAGIAVTGALLSIASRFQPLSGLESQLPDWTYPQSIAHFLGGVAIGGISPIIYRSAEEGNEHRSERARRFTGRRLAIGVLATIAVNTAAEVVQAATIGSKYDEEYGLGSLTGTQLGENTRDLVAAGAGFLAAFGALALCSYLQSKRSEIDTQA